MIQPNSFRPIPEGMRLRRNDFHRQIGVLDYKIASSPPSKGQICRQPGDYRAQDQGSSSIEV
jgi:hypothetical protein